MKNEYPFTVALLCLLTSCENSPEQKSQKTSVIEQANDSTSYVKSASDVKEYRNASTSTVTGTLKIELYYGAPNYGESPETDAKEYTYILYPDTPINIIYSVDSSEFDVQFKGITKFQLTPLGNIGQLSLDPFVNKRITVTGEFFGKHTGHHHTDILMTVSKIKK